MLTVAPAAYVPLPLAGDTDRTVGAIVSITMSFWEPSESAEDGAGRDRTASLPAGSLIAAPPGSDRADAAV